MPSAKDVKAETSFIKAFVSGPVGSGKSSFAATFPTPAFLFDFDKGVLTYQGLDVDYEQYDINAAGWVKFEKDLKQLVLDVAAGKYKTVIIDSTSAMTDLAMERALALDPKRSATNGPVWNVHYGMVKNLMEGKMRQILSLNCNILVIGHLRTKTDDDGNILDIEPLLTGDLSVRIPGYFDEVYVATTQLKGGKTEYVLQTATRGFLKARSRLSGREGKFPTFIPNSYHAVMECVNGVRKEEKK